MPDFEPEFTTLPDDSIEVDCPMSSEWTMVDAFEGEVPSDETSTTPYNYTIHVKDDGTPAAVSRPHPLPYFEDPNAPATEKITVFIYDAGKGETKGKKVKDMPISPIRDR